MANKRFKYRVGYYPAEQVQNVTPTKREAHHMIVEATSVTRAIARAKKDDYPGIQRGDLIVSVTPIDADRYSV